MNVSNQIEYLLQKRIIRNFLVNYLTDSVDLFAFIQNQHRKKKGLNE